MKIIFEKLYEKVFKNSNNMKASEEISVVRSSATPQYINKDKKLKSFLIPVRDILNGETEPTKWIIQDILPEGAIVLISAPPAHYKTFLALDIGRSVSVGEPFLGRKTQQKTVYYIDKENPKAVQKDYLQKLEVSEDCTMVFWPHWCKDKDEPPFFPKEIYLELAKETPLIIFDSFIRFYPRGTDENSSTDMSTVMKFLRALTKEGATVLVIHHTGKGEESLYRGSSDILGAVDMAFSIKNRAKKNEKTTFDLKCIKSRFSLEKDISVEVISDENKLRFEDASLMAEREREQKETNNMEALKELIARYEGHETPNQTEVIKKASEELHLPERTTYDLLNKGDGKYWTTIPGGKTSTAKIYRIIKESSVASQDIYIIEKPKSLDDIQEDSLEPEVTCLT
jgi:hypothetical protein